MAENHRKLFVSLHVARSCRESSMKFSVPHVDQRSSRYSFSFPHDGQTSPRCSFCCPWWLADASLFFRYSKRPKTCLIVPSLFLTQSNLSHVDLSVPHNMVYFRPVLIATGLFTHPPPPNPGVFFFFFNRAYEASWKLVIVCRISNRDFSMNCEKRKVNIQVLTGYWS